MKQLRADSIARSFRLAEKAPMNMVFLDEDLNVAYINNASLQALQSTKPLTAQQVVGISLQELLGLTTQQMQSIADASSNPISFISETDSKSTNILVTPFKDETIPLSGKMVVWRFAGEDGAENSLEKISSQLLALESVFSILKEKTSFIEAIDEAISATAIYFGVTYGCYWQKSMETGKLHPQLAWFAGEEDDFNHSVRLARGEGVPGQAWERRQVVTSTNLEECNDPRWENTAFSENFTYGVATPVIVSGNLYGVIEFLSSTPLETMQVGSDVLSTLGKVLGDFLVQTHLLSESTAERDDIIAQCNIIKTVTGIRDFSRMIQTVVDSFIHEFDWHMGSYWDIGQDGKSTRTYLGGSVRTAIDTLNISEDNFVSAAITNLDVVVITDTKLLVETPRIQELYENNLVAGAIIPIITEERVIGFFEFYTTNYDGLTVTRWNSIRELGEAISSIVVSNQALTDLIESGKDGRIMAELMEDLSGCQGMQEASMLVLYQLVEAYDWMYGACWNRSTENSGFTSEVTAGEISDAFYDLSEGLKIKDGPVAETWDKQKFSTFDFRDYKEALDPHLEEALKNGVTHGIYFPIECDGETLLVIEFLIKRPEGFSEKKISVLSTLLQAITNAFTRIHKATEQLEASQSSEAIAALMDSLDTATNKDDAIQKSLDVIKERFDWDYGVFLSLNTSGDYLEFTQDSGTISEEFSESSRAAKIKRAEDLGGKAWELESLAYFPAANQAPECERKKLASEGGVQTCLAFPVKLEESIIGVMEFYLTYPMQFSNVRLEAISSLSHVISSELRKIIDNSEKERVAQEQAEKVNQILRYVNTVSVGDMTAELEVSGSDPLGKVSEGLRELVGTFRRLLIDIGTNAESLSSAADEMSAISNQMNRNAADTSSRSEKVAEATEMASETARTVAAATEEMSASISEISRSVNETSSISQKASRRAEDAMKHVVSLGNRSEEIGEVVKLISDIASQTNLLALNATIEAARAGDLGRGFAVVANEVKELARGTSKATEEISDKIGRVQEETQSVVKLMEEIAGTIHSLNKLSINVSDSVHQQNETTGEISQSVADAAQQIANIGENIKDVSKLAGHTEQAADKTKLGSEDVATMAGRLRQMLMMFTLEKR